MALSFLPLFIDKTHFLKPLYSLVNTIMFADDTVLNAKSESEFPKLVGMFDDVRKKNVS